MGIDIEKIDKNLVPYGDTERADAAFYDVRRPPFTLYGLYNAAEERPFRRMPLSVSNEVSESMSIMFAMTVGARARFRTNSSYLLLRVTTPTVTPYTPTGTLAQMKGFDVYLRGENGERYYKSFMPPISFEDGYAAAMELPGGMQDITLYFPMYNQVSDLYIGVQETAVLEESSGYRYAKPVAFYGSSITQGCCATRTGNVYASIIGRMFDCDILNLGCSGGAKGQLPLAEYIATLPLSALVYDYDYNAPDVPFLEATHAPFFRVIREKQPHLPIIFVSQPNIERPECAERRAVIYKTYHDAVDSGDKNVYFIDGTTLFGDDDVATADSCHPNDHGYLLMAKGIGAVLQPILEGSCV